MDYEGPYCEYPQALRRGIVGSIAEEGIGTFGGGNVGQVKNSSNASPGLEIAVSNLQDYCNGMLVVVYTLKFLSIHVQCYYKAMKFDSSYCNPAFLWICNLILAICDPVT